MTRSSPNPPTRRAPSTVAWGLVAALTATRHAGAAAAEEPPRAPAPSDADAPADLVPPDDGAVGEARDLARAGRLAAAAVRLEDAFAATGDVRLLYQAGAARSLAGHHALAWRHFSQVLARGGALGDASRRHVEARLAAEQERTIAVRLRLVRGAAGPALAPHQLAEATITLRAASAPHDARAMFTWTGSDGEEIRLDPGPWIVQARTRGFRPAELFRNVVPGGGDAWEIVMVPEQVAVELRFAPPRALRGAKLRMTPLDGAATRVFERGVDQPSLTVTLPGGTWQLDLTARRHEAHVPLTVASGMPPVEVRLVRRTAGRVSPEFERNDRLMLAFGVTFMTELLVGAGIAVGGGVRADRTRLRNESLLMAALVDDATGDDDGMPGLAKVEATYPTAVFHRDQTRAMNLQTAGLVVVSSAFGLFAAALTAQARMKRRAAYIEMGVGAAMVAGGAAWMAAYLDRRTGVLAPDDPTARATEATLRPVDGFNVGASMLTGLGIGFVVFPAVALLSDTARKRRRGRTSLSPFAAPGQTGLSIRGTF